MKHMLVLGLLAGLGALSFSFPAQAAAVPCIAGKADVSFGDQDVSFDCLRVDFLSYMNIEQLGGGEVKGNAVSDMWGWVDDNATPTDATDDKYYAIVGLYCSTAFVNVTDPENPVLVGTLPDTTEMDGSACTDIAGTSKPGQAKSAKHDEAGKLAGAVWRDIKVENNTAYIVSDHFNSDTNDAIPNGGPGLQAFDLTRLRTEDADPATPAVEFDNDLAYYTDVGTFNAHNVFTYSTGTDSFAVVVGATSGTKVCAGQNAGGPLFFHIATNGSPQPPTFVGKFCADGYTHDIECVVYSGPDTIHQGREICFASNVDTLTIFDATNKTAFIQLSRTGYPYAGYTHQGSLDAQQKYFYQGDELDEKNYVLPTRTLVWDVSDLDAPELTNGYLAPVNSIDHNMYVHGDYLYQSNYTSGLRILDIHSREAPYQKAFFDTYPANNNPEFAGTWSNYLFPDGTVGLSDIYGGLYMLKPVFDAANAADIAISITPSVAETSFGEPYTYAVSVSNNGPDDATNVFFTVRLSNGGGFFDGSIDGDCKAFHSRLMKCRTDSLAAGATAQYSIEAVGLGSFDAATAITMVSADQVDSKGANNVADASVKFKPESNEDGGGAAGLWLLFGLAGSIWLLRKKSVVKQQ